jgi:hypothetical protein
VGGFFGLTGKEGLLKIWPSMNKILLLLALSFTTTVAFAHPGNTDAKGGHVDKETGKYHVHKKPDAKKDEPKKDEAKKGEPKKSEAKKTEAKKKK